MKDKKANSGVALIKRSAWLGAVISFAVLGSLCVLLWLVLAGLILYKSVTLGVSPFELLRALDARSPGAGSKFVDVLVASAAAVFVGVTFCTITAAAIGAAAAGIKALRGSHKRDAK